MLWCRDRNSGLEWQEPQVSARFFLATLEPGPPMIAWGVPWQEEQVAASVMPLFMAMPWTLFW